jgi:hypothetical protein
VTEGLEKVRDFKVLQPRLPLVDDVVQVAIRKEGRQKNGCSGNATAGTAPETGKK